MSKVVSEDSVRGSFAKLDETKGNGWLQRHLHHGYAPLLGVPWILDADVTITPLDGHQEGAERGDNPHKPGRPSHTAAVRLEPQAPRGGAPPHRAERATHAVTPIHTAAPVAVIDGTSNSTARPNT
jgi:hypothetical protein